MHRLQHMKDVLICAVEQELGDLAHADCKELGEAIDMIKDLEEAIYYCSVVKAMEENGNGHSNENGNGEEYHHIPITNNHYNGEVDTKYCGNSYKNRKMYMEAKMMKKDKSTQLRELEKYLQELSNDIVEMI